VDERLGALGARPTPRAESRPVSGWGSLTTAERRVVGLAAEGLTNREIGGELFVSHRTVANHLAHVFDKLGIRSRVELAREAARRASQ
jgi:DNA-binding CsgD family transcriptional regulator